MSAPMTKLRIAVQTEAVLLKLRSRQAFRSLTLLASASVFVLLAITVLNEAAFGALEPRVGPIYSGLLIGAVDLLIAALLMQSALKEPPETAEEKLAQSVRDITYSSLGEDLDGLRTELRDFVSDIRRLRGTVGDVTKGISSTVGVVLDLAQMIKAGPRTTDESEFPKGDSPEQ
jgi:hypothetical protein